MSNVTIGTSFITADCEVCQATWSWKIGSPQSSRDRVVRLKKHGFTCNPCAIKQAKSGMGGRDGRD